MNSLTKISVILALTAIASGKLPKVLMELRKAQILLLKDSQASKWSKAYVPTIYGRQ